MLRHRSPYLLAKAQVALVASRRTVCAVVSKDGPPYGVRERRKDTRRISRQEHNTDVVSVRESEP
jgi:hypothetical protein